MPLWMKPPTEQAAQNRKWVFGNDPAGRISATMVIKYICDGESVVFENAGAVLTGCLTDVHQKQQCRLMQSLLKKYVSHSMQANTSFSAI